MIGLSGPHRSSGAFLSKLVMATMGTLLLAEATCAQAGPAARITRSAFVCDAGIGFVVWFGPGRARIVTRSGVYVIQARKASFGRRYASGDVAFAQDGDRIVLIGAAGGPFRNCTQMRAR